MSNHLKGFTKWIIHISSVCLSSVFEVAINLVKLSNWWIKFNNTSKAETTYVITTFISENELVKVRVFMSSKSKGIYEKLSCSRCSCGCRNPSSNFVKY